MGRIEITATVADIVVAAHARTGMQQEIILCEVLADGARLPDGTRTNLTGQLHALALMPGDRIAFAARLDAQDSERRVIGTDIDDVVAFICSLPREERAGVHFRLRLPRGVRRVR